MVLLETQKLTKSFGKVKAINNLDFEIEKGETRGVIGPNGAGKTTFFNLLSGILKPTSGKIFFREKDITNLPPYKRTDIGIARSFQIANLLEGLTVKENIKIATRSSSFPSRPSFSMFFEPHGTEQKVQKILDDFSMSELVDQKAENLSHGQKRRLEIALAMAIDPDLLLLDEPTAGIAPEDRDKLEGVIRKVTKDSTVILIEHDIDIVMSLSDSITVLDRGEKLAEDIPDNIKGNKKVQKAYLGEA